MDGTDATSGRLGAVLRSLGEPGPVALGPHGPWLATTLEHAREVLTDPERFDFPMDVSRQALAADRGERSSNRSPHAITPPLAPDQVARGEQVFAAELTVASARLDRGSELDAMTFLREPVARSTTSAVLPDLPVADRDRVADLVLAWIDALGPIIASSRNPARWSRIRRTESRTRQELHGALAAVGCDDPPAVATLLAAGIQVPIAAGAWLLVRLAEDPAVAEMARSRPELARAVAWETVRVCPPTWITARITACPVELGGTALPAGTVVMVSPLLLGRLEALAPGRDVGESALDRFDPERWQQDRVRPGAWLPFGAGPHACPGRNLGLAQLTHLAGWVRGWIMVPMQPIRIDQSRGIFPRPALLRITETVPVPGSGSAHEHGPA